MDFNALSVYDWNALPESVAEAASNQGCQRGMGSAPEVKVFAGL